MEIPNASYRWNKPGLNHVTWDVVRWFNKVADDNNLQWGKFRNPTLEELESVWDLNAEEDLTLASRNPGQLDLIVSGPGSSRRMHGKGMRQVMHSPKITLTGWRIEADNALYSAFREEAIILARWHHLAVSRSGIGISFPHPQFAHRLSIGPIN